MPIPHPSLDLTFKPSKLTGLCLFSEPKSANLGSIAEMLPFKPKVSKPTTVKTFFYGMKPRPAHSPARFGGSGLGCSLQKLGRV